MSTLNNTTKARFMDRASEYATRGSRRGVNLLGWEEPEQMTAEQERQALVRKLQSLRAVVITLPKNSQDRKMVGAEISDLQDAIRALRPKLKGGKSVQQHLIDIVRERSTVPEWNRLMAEAVKRARAENA